MPTPAPTAVCDSYQETCGYCSCSSEDAVEEVDFADGTVHSWALWGDDQNIDNAYEQSQTMMTLEGNTWLAFELNTPITLNEDSMFKFDFKQSEECEIHAIALLAGSSSNDYGLQFSEQKVFQLAGTQTTWADMDDRVVIHTYSYSVADGETETFEIPLTGEWEYDVEVTHIGLVNDCDSGSSTADDHVADDTSDVGNGAFSNLQFYDA